MMAASILILYTGGTFGMVAQEDSESGAGLHLPRLSAASLKKTLLRSVPELHRLANCDVEIAMNIDSAHMDSSGWISLSERIRSRWSQYDGFVILHGTDTLPYTASALSFLLRPCEKPVVITGAQRPLSALRTDARRNLISAVEIAAHGPRPFTQKVMVFFDDRLLQGNRIRKRSALEFEAFESPHCPPLAVVGTTIQYQTHRRNKVTSHPLRPIFSKDVAILHVTPEFPADLVKESFLPRLKGLVLVIFPSGTAPTHRKEFINFLDEARERAIPIVLVTENYSPVAGSTTRLGTYEAGKPLVQARCHWASEMTPECAFVKTSLLLGQSEDPQRFRSLWKKNFCNEGTS